MAVPYDALRCWSTVEQCLVRLIFLGAVVAFWLHESSEEHRGAAVMAACAFSLVETTWTSLVVDGEFRPHWIGHTTWAQWWGNIIYTPALLFTYRVWVPSAWLRVLFFPLNIWTLEIIMGYAFCFLFGRNIAWYYSEADSLFHGNIRLYYAVPWWALGLIVEFTWEPLLLPAATALAPQYKWWLCVAVPLTIVSEALVGWPQLGLERTRSQFTFFGLAKETNTS